MVNGSSIVQEPRPAISYYHIELAEHDVMLADGLPVESYLDTGNRAMFTNASSAAALHPDFISPVREARSCAPHVVGGPLLTALHKRLKRRSQISKMD
jgi:hypothetical protein